MGSAGVSSKMGYEGLLSGRAAFSELSWEASCPCGVTGDGKRGEKKARSDDNRRRQTTYDRGQQQTPCDVREFCCWHNTSLKINV